MSNASTYPIRLRKQFQWGTSSCPVATTWRIPFRVTSRTPTLARTDISRPLRLARSRPTGMVCSIWQAMCRNGLPIGIEPIITRPWQLMAKSRLIPKVLRTVSIRANLAAKSACSVEARFFVPTSTAPVISPADAAKESSTREPITLAFVACAIPK